MAIDLSQFNQVFFEESAEHLAAMEALLLGLDIENPDSEQLNAIFRAAHSIKGSAGTFGFTDLAETTHILENLLDRIRKQELGLRADMVDAFLASGDLLQTMLEAHQGRGEVDPLAVEDVCARLRCLSEDESRPATLAKSVAKEEALLATHAPVTETRTFAIEFVPTEVSAKNEGVDNLLADLRRIGHLEILSHPETDSNTAGFWQLRLTTDAAQKDFADRVDFIADNGAWRVCEEKPKLVSDSADYGFFDGAPGLLDVDADAGYGFFVPVGNEPQPEADEGYGFFAPLPPVGQATDSLAGSVLEEGDDYGFFVPLPVQSAPPSVTEGGEERGELFGSSLVPDPGHITTPRPTQPEPARLAKTVGAGVAAGESSIRVSIEKVDQLINLVGELVITQAMLLQTAEKLGEQAPERLVHGLTQLERNTRDLQESVMSIRMMPISAVFSRFPRVVRDLSAKLGKQVELKTMGETTELDKGLIERIADPLTHLLRNSLDHGIESPEQRIAAGKSPLGTITLKAYHQAGNVVIEVGDDGAGIARDKILAKARERGLPVSDQMTDQDVFGLIFEAGFSTAEQVTDVSGRGVGMDVVRRNIQAMGGRVEIESMPGIGTRMTVRLPLTLAILDGMSVAVGSQTYILPLSAIIESLQPKVGDIKTLSNQARVIQVRGEYLPVVVLHEVFNLPSTWTDFTQGIMIAIHAEGAKAALFVDALVGQHQVVIKSLEANYRRVVGVSGATIMGDGRVALILDVSAIVGMARSNLQKAGLTAESRS